MDFEITEYQRVLSSCIVLIPARNEEDTLPKLLGQLSRYKPEMVVVVDNNSSDRTMELAKNSGAVVVYERRIGYGSACLAGIRFISLLQVKPKYICFFDADGQSNVEDIVKVATPVLARKTNYCQGSRMILNNSVNSLTLMARIANNFFAKLLSILFKRKITDLGPLRVMTWDTLISIDMRSIGFGWTIEMSTKILKQNEMHFEVPVNYNRRFKGKSKISGNFSTAIMAAFIMVITLFSTLFFWRNTDVQ
ncbi:MAG: glycosyltransferase family 2 protein [Candidatus Hodarchaeota archaeon]